MSDLTDFQAFEYTIYTNTLHNLEAIGVPLADALKMAQSQLDAMTQMWNDVHPQDAPPASV